MKKYHAYKYKMTPIIIFILIFGYSNSFSAEYTRDINGNFLKIKSYTQTKEENIANFNSMDNNLNNVSVQYKEVRISANSATFDENTNRIFLRGNILSRYKDADVYSNNMNYDFINGYFEAENVIVSANAAYMTSEKLKFYDRKIELQKISLGLNLIKLRASFHQLDFYPGWMVGQHMVFDLYSIPLFYIPTLVEDQRRNSYKLPE